MFWRMLFAPCDASPPGPLESRPPAPTTVAPSPTLVALADPSRELDDGPAGHSPARAAGTAATLGSASIGVLLTRSRGKKDGCDDVVSTPPGIEGGRVGATGTPEDDTTAAPDSDGVVVEVRFAIGYELGLRAVVEGAAIHAGGGERAEDVDDAHGAGERAAAAPHGVAAVELELAGGGVGDEDKPGAGAPGVLDVVEVEVEDVVGVEVVVGAVVGVRAIVVAEAEPADGARARPPVQTSTRDRRICEIQGSEVDEGFVGATAVEGAGAVVVSPELAVDAVAVVAGAGDELAESTALTGRT